MLIFKEKIVIFRFRVNLKERLKNQEFVQENNYYFSHENFSFSQILVQLYTERTVKSKSF